MKKKYKQIATYVSEEEKQMLVDFALASQKSVAQVMYDAVAGVVGFKKVVQDDKSGTVSSEESDTFP